MALLFQFSRSNWNLEMLVFVEGGKPEYLAKHPWRKDIKNRQQTQPTYDAGSELTLVPGGECSHHCAIPAPRVRISMIRSGQTMS